MEDGELDSSNQEAFSDSNLEAFLDEMLKDAHACSHTHTCNPPGPDSSHTHTCVHVHTKIVPAESSELGKDNSEDTSDSMGKKPKKRAMGNREAVRKYREKKKARTASLEEEVVKLKAVNQQLLKRLQGQAALEAEVARLKCLLVDIRGRIEGEIGSFPYQKRGNVNLGNGNGIGGGIGDSYVINPCNVQCGDQVYCLNDGNDGNGVAINGPQQGYSGCEFESPPCVANLSNPGLKELPDRGVGDRVSNGCYPGGNKRKGGNHSG